MFKFIVLMLLSFSAVADEWSTPEIIGEATYLTLHAVDWAQTLQFKNQNIRENGAVAKAIIGAYPTNRQINQYMAGSAILQFAIANALPHKWRSKFILVAALDAGGSVVNNFSIGVRIPI